MPYGPVPYPFKIATCVRRCRVAHHFRVCGAPLPEDSTCVRRALKRLPERLDAVFEVVQRVNSFVGAR